MQEINGPDFPADLLDRLVMDSVELERLTQRLIQMLDASDLVDMPKGRIAVQLLEVLVRLAEAGDVLHQAAVDQMKSVAAAVASDLLDERAAFHQDDPSACRSSRPRTRRRTGGNLEPVKETVEQAT